jgi:transcriptional regulator with XRE-family HTH domain
MSIEIFARRIRELREEKGLGVRELAAILDISHSAISLYENQKRVPDILVSQKFALYFGTTCDYLIGLTDERCK